MSQNDLSTGRSSHFPPPGYGWRVVTEDQDSTARGYSAASNRSSTEIYEIQPFRDRNDSTGGQTKTAHVHKFIDGDEVTADKTTQDLTPTAPSYDIIESRAILNYRTDNVVIPIREFPADNEHLRVPDDDREKSTPSIHGYKQITPHLDSNFETNESEQCFNDQECLPIYIILAASLFCGILFGGVIFIGRYNAHQYESSS